MNPRNTLHSIMLAATLGVLSWNAYTTQQLTTAVARMEERQQAIVSESSNLDRDLMELRSRVTLCEIKLAELSRSP